MEARRFRDRIADYESHNAVVLGISTDTAEDNRIFKERERLPFPLLCDTDRRVCLAYGACVFASAYYANRITYIIDENGVIRNVYPDVDPATHADQILTSL